MLQSFSLQWVTGKWDSFLKALTPVQASEDQQQDGGRFLDGRDKPQHSSV